MTTDHGHAQGMASGATVFARVVAGVDGSERGYDAARVAARLVAPDGSLTLFTAVYLADASLAGATAPRAQEELEQEARETVERAKALAPHGETRLVDGEPVSAFKQELKERAATLAVIGSRGKSRLSELVLGGFALELLRHTPCSVCIARPTADETAFPHAIVVGCDGSDQSDAAVAAARSLAERYDAPLRLVAALGGKGVDRERVAALGGAEVEGEPARALVEAAAEADLVVVGSRGLHGFKAFGSVSERVAHDAPCSVLVVRTAA